MSKPQPVAVETPKENETSYEQSHVHDVYEVIATHFSDTRYKASRSDPSFEWLILLIDPFDFI